MTDYVYAGAAPFIGSRPEAEARGLHRLDPATGKWDRLTRGLPDGVEVRAIAVRPGAPEVLYAGTQLGPCRSTDAGETWTALPLPGREKVVWSILIDPRDPDTIFVGTEGTTVYRSRDGGRTWVERTPPAPEGMCHIGFPSRVIRLALDPGEPDTLYAGLEVGGVMRSTDGGETWEGCNAHLLAMAEAGKVETRSLLGAMEVSMMDTHALATSPRRPGSVFLANRLGLFRSDDRARHWQEMRVGRFSPLTYARDVQVSRHDPATLYAALSVAAVSDEGSLWRSRDEGETWQRFDHGVAMESTLMAIAESPARPERLYCATRRGQVLGTEDGGRSWRDYRLPDGCQGIYGLVAA